MLVKHNRQTALGWLIRQALDGEDITIFGDGSQLRDYTYVDDAVDAFLLAGASDAANGQTFNLGGVAPISLRDTTEVLIDVAGSGSYHLEAFPDELNRIQIGSVYVDDAKIRRALGWSPKVGLREGLTHSVTFYRAHRAHYWDNGAEP